MSTCRHEQILERLRPEYREMPDMRLKLEQVRRLCGTEQPLCKLALEALVEAKFLRLGIRRSLRAVRASGSGSLRCDPRFQALGAALVSVDKRNIRCARPVYILKGIDESSCLGTAHAPSRRRSGSLWPACFMLPRLASRGGTSRAVCC